VAKQAKKTSKKTAAVLGPALLEGLPEPQAVTVAAAHCRVSAMNRRHIDAAGESFASLVESVRAAGVTQPIQVRPLTGEPDVLEVVTGSRRLAACLACGRTELPAIRYDGLTDEGAAMLMAIENLDREDLSPLEEGATVAALLEGARGDAAAVAASIGRPVKWVRGMARLPKLTEGWQAVMELEPDERSGSLADVTSGHLMVVAKYPPETQDAILERVGRHYSLGSLDRFQRNIQAEHEQLLTALPWEIDDAELEPAAGACSTCTKRSSAQGLLFHDEAVAGETDAKDRCLDRACLERKRLAWIRRRFTELAAKPANAGLILVADHHLSDDDRAPYEEIGPVHLHYRVSNVKKSQPGAVPALAVNGPKMGKTRWVLPDGRGGGSSRPKGPDGKAAPLPLKERRAKLQKRRDVLFVKKVQVAVVAKPAPESVDLVVAAAAAFGTVGKEPGARGWKAFKELRTTPSNAKAVLWEATARVLAQGIEYYPGMAPRVDEAKQICDLAGIDAKALQAECRLEITEPKSWRNLKADGTPASGRRRSKSTAKTASGRGKSTASGRGKSE